MAVGARTGAGEGGPTLGQRLVAGLPLAGIRPQGVYTIWVRLGRVSNQVYAPVGARTDAQRPM
jgi:hypothetical protein